MISYERDDIKYATQQSITFKFDFLKAEFNLNSNYIQLYNMLYIYNMTYYI